MPKLKILLVTANGIPSAPLRVDHEFRTIKERLPTGTAIDITLAARLRDIIADINSNEPNVVHFSAHGSPLEEIILLDGPDDQPKEIPQEAFQKLFEILQIEIRLVFFNACYSRTQAEGIAPFVDCVIGVSGKIPDYAALKYSTQLYSALAAGRSVQQAHDEGMVLLIADRLPTNQCPELIATRTSAEEVFFGRRPSGRQQARKQKRALKLKHVPYSELLRRYGVGANVFSVRKVCNADGSSTLFYEIKGLTVTKGELRGLHFAIESAAGLVGDPALDNSATDLSISWRPDPAPDALTMDSIIDKARSLSGTFEFDEPIRPNGPPCTFSWTVWIRNSDALTAWDFVNLYSNREQLHVNGKALAQPQEYFARLVWFPVHKLVVGLELPSIVNEKPFLRYFQLKEGPNIPGEAIIKDGVLWSMPSRDSAWHVKNRTWEPDLKTQEAASSALQREGKARSMLSVKSPPLGSCYSLDWRLPDLPVKPELERIFREAEVVREQLLKYRERRRNNVADALSSKIADLFRGLHEQIYLRYGSDASNERFQTTLMTYDQPSRRLLVADGRLNAGEMDFNSWEFWLPFGFGLAGACFRAGVSFCYSRRLDQGNPEIPEHYVPVPGTPPHEFLLTLPIDHPQLNAGMMGAIDLQRCHQLVGVLTIGSTYKASRLLEICQQPLPTDKFNELRELRDRCQDTFDQISGLLLAKKA